MVCPGPLQVPSRSFSGTFWARYRSCLASVQVSPAWVSDAHEVREFKSSKKCTHPDSNPRPFGRGRLDGGEYHCAKLAGIAVPATMARPTACSKSETRKRPDPGQVQDPSRSGPGQVPGQTSPKWVNPHDTWPVWAGLGFRPGPPR